MFNLCGVSLLGFSNPVYAPFALGSGQAHGLCTRSFSTPDVPSGELEQSRGDSGQVADSGWGPAPPLTSGIQRSLSPVEKLFVTRGHAPERAEQLVPAHVPRGAAVLAGGMYRVCP